MHIWLYMLGRKDKIRKRLRRNRPVPSFLSCEYSTAGSASMAQPACVN
jgi:ribosomal protein L39E